MPEDSQSRGRLVFLTASKGLLRRDTQATTSSGYPNGHNGQYLTTPKRETNNRQLRISAVCIEFRSVIGVR